MPRLIAPLIPPLLAAAAVALPLGNEDPPPASARVGVPAPAPPPMTRVVSARVEHTRINTVRNSNSRRIGRSLAGLHPTWVTGLLRYAQGQHPKHKEIRAWNEIRRIVHTTSPEAQFDVVLNAEQYGRGRELLRMMHRVRSVLHNDGWFFDFYSSTYLKRPRMIRAAIADAHAHGEWIGGNIFGLSRRLTLPLRSDYFAVQDFNFKLNKPAVRRMSTHRPVMYHLNNNPARPKSGGCRFIKDLTTARRMALIRHRAKQQARYGYRVSYPAFFPQCLHSRHRGKVEFLRAYNAFRDPPMVRTILRLLDRYD
jgi:hypothetical protein